ncbi:MAG: hypothetical protein IJP30_04760 [Clostridia bacterium]|nr:hypothetical protein [Clostridia bacterium]
MVTRLFLLGTAFFRRAARFWQRAFSAIIYKKGSAFHHSKCLRERQTPCTKIQCSAQAKVVAETLTWYMV